MNSPPALHFVTCVGRAYETLWAERRYFLRLAAIPFLLKIVFFTIGYSHGGDENVLRLSLIMIPAWLAEGWMLAHAVRLVTLGQRWPFQPTGDKETDLPILHRRYRGVMGGLIFFALIQLLIGGWFAALMYFVPVSLSEPGTPVQVTPGAATAACMLLGLALYFFRFIWLYVPAAAGAPVHAAARALSPGMAVSFRLLGLWLLCSVPALIAVQLIVGGVLALGAAGQEDMLMTLSVIAKAVFDILKNLLCALAMAYVFRDMAGGKASRA